MTLEPGRIVLVNYPFTDLTRAKLRPALIVSAGKFNLGEDVIAVPISSQIREGDEFGYPILDSVPFFEHTKLRCSSTVKWSKPMTISQKVVRRKLGVIPNETLEEVRRRIRGLFDKIT